MKKILIIIVFIMSMVFLSSCNKEPKFDQSNFLGMGDVLVTENVTRADIDERVNIMKQMGVKSHRFWIRVGRYNSYENPHCLFRIENNQLVLNDAYYNDTLYAIGKLREAGIEHITLNISWMYGKENGNYVYYGGVMPSPNEPEYEGYMDIVYEIYYRIAELYEDLPYIEMGNEYNGNFLAFGDTTKYPLELKTKFIIDFSYYASKGVHDANPNMKTVLNGVLDLEYQPYDEKGKLFLECHGTPYLIRFFEELYTQIESGVYPSFEEEKSTNPDDYFEVIAYHPYSIDTAEQWVTDNNKIYDVIKKHGDNGKEVIITEWGLPRILGEGGRVYRDICNIKSKTPYIVAVHYYILSDAIDLDLYCLCRKDEQTGKYVLTENGQAFCPDLVLKSLYE